MNENEEECFELGIDTNIQVLTRCASLVLISLMAFMVLNNWVTKPDPKKLVRMSGSIQFPQECRVEMKGSIYYSYSCMKDHSFEKDITFYPVYEDINK